MEKNTILSFDEFHPEKELMKKYDNVLTCRQKDKIAFIFMTQEATDLPITVQNPPTLGSPLSLAAYKEGVRIPQGNKILNPNNGLKIFSIF